MDDAQKQVIQDMRSRGISYAQIANEVRLSANTVKSFCRRNDAERSLCKKLPQAARQQGKKQAKNFLL